MTVGMSTRDYEIDTSKVNRSTTTRRQRGTKILTQIDQYIIAVTTDNEHANNDQEMDIISKVNRFTARHSLKIVSPGVYRAMTQHREQRTTDRNQQQGDELRN